MEIDILANKYIKSSDWNYMKQNKLITKTYAFETFPNAIAWMTEVAFKCEKINHHPDWTNVFSKVIVNLTTHDKGEVTEKDLTLAKIMDDIYAKYKK